MTFSVRVVYLIAQGSNTLFTKLTFTCFIKSTNRNIRKRCKICSIIILNIKQHYWRRSDAFIINFKHSTPFTSVSIVDFEQVNVTWVMSPLKRVGSQQQMAQQSFVECLTNILIAWMFLYSNWITKQKSFLRPRTSVDDEPFAWTMGTLVLYCSNLKVSGMKNW